MGMTMALRFAALRCLRRRPLLVAVIAFFCVAAQNAWASTTVDFSTPVISGSSPDGPGLGTQYESQGLVFSPDTSSLTHPIELTGCGRSTAVLYRDSADAYPPSDQVADSWEECDELLQQSAQFVAELTTPSNFVSLEVGMPGGSQPGLPEGFSDSDVGSGGTPILTAYDADGNVLGTDQVTVGAKADTDLAVEIPTDDISYFSLEGASSDQCCSGPLEVGQVNYGPGSPTTPIPPAMVIAATSGTADIYTSKTSGGSATEKFTLTRENGSAGAVKFSISGLPSGVSAQINPSESSTSGNQSGTVTLTAPAGTLGSNEATVTLTATPVNATDSGSAVSTTFGAHVENTYTSSSIAVSLAQAAGDPAQTGASGSSVSYDGVPLVAGRKTLVRVFADPVGLLINGSSGLDAELTGTGPNGQALPGGPLSPVQANPAALSDETFATQLGQADTSFDFVLPVSWSTAGPITLTASVSPPQYLVTPPAQTSVCSPCASSVSLKLTNVSFTQVPTLVITPVELTWKNSKGVVQTPASLGQALRFALETAPISSVSLPADGYASAQIDLSSLVSDGIGSNNADFGAGALLQQWASQQYSNDGDTNQLGSAVLGFNEGLARGVTYARYTIGGNDSEPVAVVDTNRPISSVAHELNHTFGRLHADQVCGGPAGGGSDPDWPDQSGYIEPTANFVNGPSKSTQLTAAGASYGVDMSDATGGLGAISSQPFTIYPSSTTYDFMSYCAGAPDNNNPPTATNPETEWISARGWAQALSCTQASPASGCPGTQFNGGAADTATASAAKGPSILFLGAVEPGGTLVSPTLLQLPSGGGVGAVKSSYSAQLVGTGGQLVSKEPLSSNLVHLEKSPGHPAVPLISLEGFLPTHGKAIGGVVVKSGGKQLMRIKAPRQKPRVTLKRVKIGKHATSVTIRWSSHDHARGTRLVFIAFAKGKRRHFQTVWEGGDVGKAKLPLSAFDGASSGRLRVTVSNGFASSSATVKLRKIPVSVHNALRGPEPAWVRWLEAAGIRVVFR